MITIKSGTSSLIALTLEEKTPSGFGNYSISLFHKTTRNEYEFDLDDDLTTNVDRYNLFLVDFDIPVGQYDYTVMAYSLTGATGATGASASEYIFDYGGATGATGATGASASEYVRVESGRLNVEKI